MRLHEIKQSYVHGNRLQTVKILVCVDHQGCGHRALSPLDPTWAAATTSFFGDFLVPGSTAPESVDLGTLPDRFLIG